MTYKITSCPAEIKPGNPRFPYAILAGIYSTAFSPSVIWVTKISQPWSKSNLVNRWLHVTVPWMTAPVPDESVYALDRQNSLDWPILTLNKPLLLELSNLLDQINSIHTAELTACHDHQEDLHPTTSQYNERQLYRRLLEMLHHLQTVLFFWTSASCNWTRRLSFRRHRSLYLGITSYSSLEISDLACQQSEVPCPRYRFTRTNIWSKLRTTLLPKELDSVVRALVETMSACVMKNNTVQEWTNATEL